MTINVYIDTFLFLLFNCVIIQMKFMKIAKESKSTYSELFNVLL